MRSSGHPAAAAVPRRLQESVVGRRVPPGSAAWSGITPARIQPAER
ncbi:hypothetical protein STXM2123_2539 [Streptomyces sp. F-3]|nr:hypothetical protein STXM2123_2539 [Streptomyces sp. F-3]